MKHGILKIVTALGIGLLGAMPAQAQQYVWSNLTGNPGGAGSMNGAGSVARFYYPSSVAVDAGGSVYVADTGNQTIRKLVFSGTTCTASTLAGTSGVSGATDGPGSSALFNNPCGIAVDTSGNVYVADSGNNTIRKVTPDGTVSTIAGNPGQSGSADGTGTGALFSCPMGIAVDSSMNLYVTDSYNHTIRKVTAGGSVTTLAGTPNVMGSSDGTGRGALFNTPGGITVDASGNLFVADTLNHTIRKITPTGVVTTLAGTPTQYGSQDGTGIGAQFNTPGAVSVDASGNVYVADTYNSTLRQVTAAGVVTTLSGTASVTGWSDGVGPAAWFNFPQGVAVDSGGNIYLADTNNHAIRKKTGVNVTTVAGSAPKPGSAGSGTSAYFNYPIGITIDSTGNLYVADTKNQKIVECTGTGNFGISGYMLYPGSADGTGAFGGMGSSSVSRFNYPGGITMDSGTNLYLADTHNNMIRKIALVSGTWTTTTICGSAATQGSLNGSGTSAMFNNPIGIAVDSGTNLYVADTYNNTIRLLSYSGGTWTASTISGSAGVTGTSDGTGNGALFAYPQGVAVDSATNVYVADSGNSTIRMLTYSGGSWSSQTIAGSPGTTGTTDGVGSAALFNYPTQLAVDSSGNVFVADTGNSTIRMLTKSGANWTVSTVGGTPGVNGGVPGIGGIGTQAQFSAPMGIVIQSGATAANDVIYVLDSANNRISMGSCVGTGTASSITNNNAVLSGVINPEGLSTSVYFQYGKATTYGSTTGTQTIGSGTTSFVTLTGTFPSALSSNTLYDYRMVVVNSSGTFYGANQTLTTLPSGIPAITSGTLITGTNGYPLTSTTITATNGPISYGVTSLPAGLVLNPATGVISGTPTVTASTSTFLTAVNAVGTGSSAATFNIVNLPPPAFTCSTAVTFPAGSLFSYTISASYGPPSYGISGSPTGWTVNPYIGVLSGSLAVAGTTQLTLVATNISGSSTMPLTITVEPPYLWSNFAGMPTVSGSADGTGTNARFCTPYGVAVDSGSNIYVGDTTNQTIRKITPAGVVTTLAGSPRVTGNADGTGTNARFYNPRGVAMDSGSNIYVGDSYNQTIRKITPAGVVTTLAGLPGTSGTADGTGTNARLYNPYGVAVDSGSNVYVADCYNSTIRKITPAGAVTTFAGSPLLTGSADGTGTNARFYYPYGVAVDSGSNVYVADTTNQTIRKVTPAGVVTTLAGSPRVSGSADGTGTNANFNAPTGITVDSNNNIYVTNGSSLTIRKMMLLSNGSWNVTTIGGTPGVSGTTGGVGTAALFAYPTGIAVTGGGSLFVADSTNYNISSGTVLQPPTITSVQSATGTNGFTFGYTITATNGPLNYAVNSLSAVTGLSLDPLAGIISGTPTLSGTFPLSISAGNLAGSGTATCTLTILPALYGPWTTLAFSPSQLANPTVSGASASPAGDGIANLMKYALHLKPWVNDISGLPVQSITPIGGSNYLTLTYTQVLSATDLTYTVEISTDLQTWHSGASYLTAPSAILNPDGLTAKVTVRSLVPIDSNTPKQFIRLRVTTTP